MKIASSEGACLGSLNRWLDDFLLLLEGPLEGVSVGVSVGKGVASIVTVSTRIRGEIKRQLLARD
jgi:hypothetical protein